MPLSVLTPTVPLPASAAFGTSVAIDRRTAVVGVPFGTDGLGVDCGAAHIFRWSGTSWTWNAQLPYNGNPGDQFGWDVAIRGRTVVVGAPFRSQTGATFVFRWRPGSGAWDFLASLPTGDAFNVQADSKFGHSVAIGGKVVVVGAPNAPFGGESGVGAAYVFKNWGQEAALSAGDAGVPAQCDDDSDPLVITGPPPPLLGFGHSVAIDQDTIVVGAPDWIKADGEACQYQAGRVYVYRREPAGAYVERILEVQRTTWGVAGQEIKREVVDCNDQAAYPGSDPECLYYDWTREYNQFGCSVAIDGDTIVAGARGYHTENRQPAIPIDGPSKIGGGAALVWRRDPTNVDRWFEEDRLFHPDPVNTLSGFGSSVTIHRDSIVVGAPQDDVDTGPAGSAYLFRRGAGLPAEWTRQPPLVAGIAGPNRLFGSSVDLYRLPSGAERVVVGAPGASGGKGSGYAFS